MVVTLARAGAERPETERAEADSAAVESIAPRLEERSRNERSFEALGLTA